MILVNLFINEASRFQDAFGGSFFAAFILVVRKSKIFDLFVIICCLNFQWEAHNVSTNVTKIEHETSSHMLHVIRFFRKLLREGALVNYETLSFTVRSTFLRIWQKFKNIKLVEFT